MMETWDRVERTLVGVLGLAALAFALWQVVSRYFFPQQSISYAEEVIVYLVIWAIMIVSSQLVRTDRHVRPDLVLKVRHDGFPRAFCRTAGCRNAGLPGAGALRRRDVRGLNLFVLSSIAVAPMADVIRGILPFLVILLIVLAVITYVPVLTLWLPGAIFGP
jgi:hypothetical protein